MKIILLGLGIALAACGGAAREDAKPFNESPPGKVARQEPESVAVPAGPQSILVPPSSDIVQGGSVEQESEVRLPPVAIGGARVPLAIEYEEGTTGEVIGPALSYRLQDQAGLLFAVDVEFAPGRSWAFNGSSPIRIRLDGTERGVVGGTLTLRESSGNVTLEFVDLEVEGSSSKLNGHISGRPIERCRHLMAQTGGAFSPGADTRALAVDEAWASDFCSGIERRFP